MVATSTHSLAAKTAAPPSQYLYAVIECDQDRVFDSTGIDGAAVRALSDGRIAAVASEAPNAKLRPERRRLAAHHETLKRLRQQCVVLPVAFGLIAESDKAARDILGRNRDAFLEQIRRVAGKVEMGLRVRWDVSNMNVCFDEDVMEPMPEAELSGAEHISLCETLDRVLNQGVVVAGEVMISVANVDLIYLGLQLVLTSVDSARQPRLFEGGVPQGAKG